MPTSNLSKIENGKRSASDNDLRKLASVSELDVDYDTLKAWLALERFTERQLLEAVLILYPNAGDRAAAFVQLADKETGREKTRP